MATSTFVIDLAGINRTTASATGLAESVVSLFVGFGCLAVAWLCVALGLWRRP